jgi:transcriptional regulator with XRE-family HTH domain
VSEKLRVQPANVSFWETGRRVPNLGSLERLASALGVPLFRFFLEDGVEGQMDTNKILKDAEMAFTKHEAFPPFRCSNCGSHEDLEVHDVRKQAFLRGVKWALKALGPGAKGEERPYTDAGKEAVKGSVV